MTERLAIAALQTADALRANFPDRIMSIAGVLLRVPSNA